MILSFSYIEHIIFTRNWSTVICLHPYVGIISSTWDLFSLLSFLVTAHFAGRGHRTRWLAIGSMFVGLSCFVRLLPHLIYGAGDEVLQYTVEYGSNTNNTSLQSNITSELKKKINQMYNTILKPKCRAYIWWRNRTKWQDLRWRTVDRRLPKWTVVERGGFSAVRRARNAGPGRFAVLDVRRCILGRQRPQEHCPRAAGWVHITIISVNNICDVGQTNEKN